MTLSHTLNPNSIKDKIVIVTGANRGIGFELAQSLSSQGANLIIACRSEENGLEAQNKLGGNCKYLNLDLTSFRSIESFCKSVASNYPKVDVLVNNAGVMCLPFTKTSEGLELTFGVNYIGYYLLTNKLMPLIKHVKNSRVVNISSIAHYRVKTIDWENLNSQKKYNKMDSYNLSNLFRIMLTLELEKKFRQNAYETIAISCHPGVVFTDLFKFFPLITKSPILVRFINKVLLQTPGEAILPIIMAIMSSEVDGGDFVGFDSKNQFKGNPIIVTPNQLVYDELLRNKLWEISVEITGMDLGSSHLR